MTTSLLHSSAPVGSRSCLRRSSCSLRPGRRFTPTSARRRESESRSSRKFRPASPAIAAVPDHPGKAPARDCHRPSPDTPRPHTGCESAWPWSGQTTAPQPRRSSPMCHFSRTDPFGPLRGVTDYHRRLSSSRYSSDLERCRWIVSWPLNVPSLWLQRQAQAKWR